LVRVVRVVRAVVYQVGEFANALKTILLRTC